MCRSRRAGRSEPRDRARGQLSQINELDGTEGLLNIILPEHTKQKTNKSHLFV